MRIVRYLDGNPFDTADIPEDVFKAVVTLDGWIFKQGTDRVSINGIGKVLDLQRQLTEVTRERDTLKAMVDLHDALNDRRRAQANETTFKRRKYESL